MSEGVRKESVPARPCALVDSVAMLTSNDGWPSTRSGACAFVVGKLL